MSQKKQATGGSSNKGPGNGNGLGSYTLHKSKIGPRYKTSPNSANRGKQGNG